MTPYTVVNDMGTATLPWVAPPVEKLEPVHDVVLVLPQVRLVLPTHWVFVLPCPVRTEGFAERVAVGTGAETVKFVVDQPEPIHAAL